MGDNFKVDSNVKRVENEKSKKQEEEFQNLKKKEEEDKLKAEKKREDARLEKEQEAENLKKAQETKKLDSNELAATLVKGGVTLLIQHAGKKDEKMDDFHLYWNCYYHWNFTLPKNLQILQSTTGTCLFHIFRRN